MPEIAANGITLHYESAGEGPPLLLITGVGYGAWFWRWVIPDLSRDYRVITFDNRGVGQSSRSDGPYSTALLAADAAGLLDAFGIVNANVVGHSLGGFIAQELALARPDLVGRLVLAATTCGGPNVVPITSAALDVLTNRSGDPVQLIRRGIAIACAPGFADAHPNIVAELMAYRLSGPITPAHYQAQVMAGALHNAEARIAQIACPTLILFGAHDQVVPPANADLLAQRLSQAHTVILPNAGHIFPIEEPAGTAAALRAFFAEKSAHAAPGASEQPAGRSGSAGSHTQRFAQIISTGRYVPEQIVTNAEISAILGQDVGPWLLEKVGIAERHVIAPDQVTSDLVVAAAQQALARANLTAQDLDLIIVATDTPDYLSPATASVVQGKMNAANAGTFDVNCACAAWVTALDIGSRYIASDPNYRYILVAGAYAMTRFLDWHDKQTATLFADGAGAVILGAGDQPGFLGSKLAALGEYHDALGVYTGGSFRPATPETVAAEGKPRVQFVRKFPATFNSERWPLLIRQVTARAGLTVDDVDWFFFTQLNVNTIKAVMANLGQPLSKTHWVMDKWGYTGSACIPMALDDALEQARLTGNPAAGPRPGDHVIFCATGGGMAIGCVLFRWS